MEFWILGILWFILLPIVVAFDITVVHSSSIGVDQLLLLLWIASIVGVLWLKHKENEGQKQYQAEAQQKKKERIQQQAEKQAIQKAKEEVKHKRITKKLSVYDKLLESKPKNVGQPQQMTDADRGTDSPMCSEEEFMQKLKCIGKNGGF